MPNYLAEYVHTEEEEEEKNWLPRSNFCIRLNDLVIAHL